MTSVIMGSMDSETGEVVDEELDPTNIQAGYKTLVDFFKRTDHSGLYITIPDACLMFEISFEPRLGLSLDRYADSLRRFMDRVQSTVTRSSKDYGYLKFFVYSKPNLSCTFPMFRPLAPVNIIDSYELIYDTELDINPETLGEDISSHACEQFTRDVPRLLNQSVSLNERIAGRHGVWIEYESFRWIAPRSFLICAHARRRFKEEPVSVTNVLFVLTRTLFVYFPDSIILDNAVCVSVTADETIDEVNNKTSQLGRPDQTRIDDNIHINVSARPECMDLRDGRDKEVRSNRFIRLMLSKGDSMNTDSFPVGVIFPQKNGYIAQKWYDLKVRYAGTVRHREWFQPFIETKLIDN